MASLSSPLGVKLEVTHRCNLRCAFCYTDSPRRTLERPSDLDGEAWLAIVEDALGLGIVEAVITGGEPLMRAEVTLGLVDRLAAENVSVMMNTNGWFVSDAVADRLAAAAGLRVHISIDGAGAVTHDASRGVPGGWGRAIRAIDRLLARGVRVTVVHVAVPGRESEIPVLLEQMWSLGVDAVRVTQVAVIGAAARGGSWSTATSRLRAEIARARTPGMRIDLQTDGSDDDVGRQLPSLLVRPNGDVVPDSRRPFAVGHALGDGLAVCWQRVRTAAADSVGRVPAGHVAYRDPDVRLDGRPMRSRPEGRSNASDPVEAERASDPNASTSLVEELALGRRHDLRSVRLSAPAEGRYVRVTATRKVHHLNAASACVLEACTSGTVGGAVDALQDRSPGVARERIKFDVMRTVRELRECQIITPTRG
jgi:MoaA/NifB/PqqE/SkfB family radical SAM enzyme